MKIKIIIIAAFSILLFWSCTPEVDDDQLIIYSQNNSVYELYYSLDTLAVVVKTRYRSNPVRNGVSLGDTSYSANTLFARSNTLDTLWLYLQSLNNDSDLYVADWNDQTNDLSIRFSDSLIYIRNVSSSLIGDTILFDSITFPGAESFINTSSLDSSKIDLFNNGSYFKTYRSWKDDIINIYR